MIQNGVWASLVLDSKTFGDIEYFYRAFFNAASSTSLLVVSMLRDRLLVVVRLLVLHAEAQGSTVKESMSTQNVWLPKRYIQRR